MHNIVWDLQKETRLPHTDNIEMSGQKVAGIIYYEVNKKGEVHLVRDIIFPQLRTFEKNTDPDWMAYRAYLRSEYKDEMVVPTLIWENQKVVVGAADSITINGRLNITINLLQG